MQRAVRLFLSFVCLYICGHLSFSGELTRPIHNELGLSWPGELVYMDFPADSTRTIRSVSLESADYGPKTKGKTVKFSKWSRPVQRRTISVNGKRVDRLWFVASLGHADVTDAKGRVSRLSAPLKAVVSFSERQVQTPLIVTKSDSWYVIQNGVYECRLRHYSDASLPSRLDGLKHWIAGMRPQGRETWEGKAFFEGSAQVEAVTTEVLNRGPVFFDVKLTYRFASRAEGTTDAVKLMLGKQSYLYAPNRIPKESLPKETHSYEVVIRFVMNDPWIDVAERNHLPRDPSVEGWGSINITFCLVRSAIRCRKRKLILTHQPTRT